MSARSSGTGSATRLIPPAALVISALVLLAVPAGPATAASVDRSVAAPITSPAATVDQVVTLGPANAAALDVQQSVAMVDRATGELVANHGGEEEFNTESILKLFTAAYYLVQTDGAPDADLAADLRALVTVSDNGIQSALWEWDIIPTIAERYGLSNTSNGPNASSGTWGSDRTTANDQALFLFRMSQDQVVGPLLMAWMASTAPTGADGFNQEFGFNALTGDHGSKQGWSDPGWSPANMHSVGWTDRYFAAILQSSPTATYATMRSTSTTTAKLIAAIGGSAGAGRQEQVTPSEPLVIDDVGRVIARAVKMKHVLVTVGIAERQGAGNEVC